MNRALASKKAQRVRTVVAGHKTTVKEVDEAFNSDVPPLVVSNDPASAALLAGFGDMVAIYRTALWEIYQSKGAFSAIAYKAIQDGTKVERAAIAEARKLIKAEKYPNSREAKEIKK